MVQKKVWFVLCFIQGTFVSGLVGITAGGSAESVSSEEYGKTKELDVEDGWKNSSDSNPNSPGIDIKQVLKSVCARRLDVLCAKLALILLVDRLASRSTNVEIFPGVSIQRHAAVRNDSASNLNRTSPKLPRNLFESTSLLDEYVLGSIHLYLQSLSLNIHILDSEALHQFQRFGEQALSTLIPTAQDQNTGRGKNKGYGGVAMAGLITGGSMLALALSGLAALAGKALMTALMAMMMALICLLKGHGGGGGHGGKSTHYEVISHPYFSKEHTHSAEYQTDHGSGLGSSYHGRTLAMFRQSRSTVAPRHYYEPQGEASAVLIARDPAAGHVTNSTPVPFKSWIDF